MTETELNWMLLPGETGGLAGKTGVGGRSTGCSNPAQLLVHGCEQAASDPAAPVPVVVCFRWRVPPVSKIIVIATSVSKALGCLSLEMLRYHHCCLSFLF